MRPTEQHDQLARDVPESYVKTQARMLVKGVLLALLIMAFLFVIAVIVVSILVTRAHDL